MNRSRIPGCSYPVKRLGIDIRGECLDHVIVLDEQENRAIEFMEGTDRRRIKRSSWLRSNPLLFTTTGQFLVDVVLFSAVNGIELYDIKADTNGTRVV